MKIFHDCTMKLSTIESTAWLCWLCLTSRRTGGRAVAPPDTCSPGWWDCPGRRGAGGWRPSPWSRHPWSPLGPLRPLCSAGDSIILQSGHINSSSDFYGLKEKAIFSVVKYLASEPSLVFKFFNHEFLIIIDHCGGNVLLSCHTLHVYVPSLL